MGGRIIETLDMKRNLWWWNFQMLRGDAGWVGRVEYDSWGRGLVERLSNGLDCGAVSLGAGGGGGFLGRRFLRVEGDAD
jgi:hypothetical protein